MNENNRGREGVGGLHYSQDQVIEILQNYSNLLQSLIEKNNGSGGDKSPRPKQVRTINTFPEIQPEKNVIVDER